MAPQKLHVLAVCNTHTIHCPLGRGRVQVYIVQTWPCKADALSCSLLHDETASTRTWHASPLAAATTGVNFCIMFIASTRKTQNEKHKQIGCAIFKGYAESFDCLLDRHLNGISQPCFAHGAILYMRADYFMAKGNWKLLQLLLCLFLPDNIQNFTSPAYQVFKMRDQSCS